MPPRALLRQGLTKITITFSSLLLFCRLYSYYNSCSFFTISRIPAPRNLTAEVESKDIDWDQYKYVQVVGTVQELCSAVMVWSQIEELGSRAGRIMLYPSSWPSLALTSTQDSHLHVFSANTTSPSLSSSSTLETENESILRLLQHAARESYVTLVPYTSTASVYDRLLAFNLTTYRKVLVLGSRISVREQLDEVFLIPENGVDVAMPWSWSDGKRGFVAGLMLVRPSSTSSARIEKGIAKAVQKNRELGTESDEEDLLEVLRSVFGEHEMGRLNETQYGFLTSSLRHPSPLPSHHSFQSLLFPSSSSLHQQPMRKQYLHQALQTTKIIHFSDPPLPPPWIKGPQKTINSIMPKCSRSEMGFGASDCEVRRIWMGIYRDYRRVREGVCGGVGDLLGLSML